MEGTATALHPASIAATLLLGLLLLVVPRRWCMAPIVVAAAFLPADQRIVIAGFDFNMLRILLLFAFARLAGRGELRPIRLMTLDRILIAFVLVTIVAYTLRLGSFSALVNRLGWGFDALGGYFYCRVAMRSPRDLQTAVRAAVPCAVLLAVFMGLEWSTGRNLFSLIGGVPEWSLVRDGKLRAQGAFSHPIMAGMFGASWAPLFASFWWQRERRRASIGMISALAIVFFSSSSTPLGGLVFGLTGLALWRFRQYAPTARLVAFVMLIVIHFVREKPVWHLIARVDFVGGSTGYHRFRLIDTAIQRFDEWWLLGISNTARWGMFLGDVTNEYLLAGFRGGSIALLLLVATLVVCFSRLGRSAGRRNLPLNQRRFAWAAGSMLAVHAISFLSVSYFGQMTLIWYVHLALIATAVEGARAKRPRENGDPPPPPEEPSEATA